MKRVLTAAVLIPLVLLAIFKAPLWLFALLVTLVALLALHEYMVIADGYGIATFHGVALVATAILILSRATVWVPSAATTEGLLFAAAAALLLDGMRRASLTTVLPGAAASLLGVVYVGFPLLTLVLMRQQWSFSFLLVYLLVVVWAGDIAALYAGRSLGRHKLAPRVSPKKTWEGAIASVAASVVAGLILFHFAPSILRAGGAGPWLDSHYHDPSAVEPVAIARPWIEPSWVWLSVLVNVAAQFGDLAESVLKRGAGIKDSGTVLPGHGGVLDRIDALLFAAPVLWYYAAVVQPLH